MRLLIAIATISTLTLSGCLDAVGGTGGSNGRAVVLLENDDDYDRCDKNPSDNIAIWGINGGGCDCPSGFTPVGFHDDSTVCLEDE